jgi:bifunctional non-homologous end joining protein LigD
MLDRVPKAAKPSRRRSTASARGDLSLYRQKRDFSKTPEPAGAITPKAGKGLRFVIQKHAARRLHYDLRLELGGVFKSWAVTRGPSLDPKEKRLAVQVEDHPIDYGDFEGIIPQGEYGGGTVMIWDRGIWHPDGDAAKAYAKGDLAFELDGEKLKGRWHLIRMKPRPGEKKEQWLLFKSEDQFAHAAPEGDVLEAAPDSVATHRSIEEIAEDRAAVWSSRGGLVQGALAPASESPPRPKKAGKPPAGFVDPSALKGAKKVPFPGFVEPCLALLAAKPPEGDGWLHEIKLDGYRLIATIEDGRVRLFTRREQDWTRRFPGIAKALEALRAKSAILDGEAIVEDRNGVPSFSALQEALSERRQAGAAILCAFDLLYFDGYDLRAATLDDRKSALASLLGSSHDPHLCFSQHVIGNGQAMIEHACRLGLEGIVSKRRDAPYRPGRRGEWTKTKCTDNEEFVIGGYTPSAASRYAVGSLALGYYEGGKLIYAGRTGTGFTQKSAQAVYRSLQDLRLSRSPFANALTSAERRGLIFTKPQCVAEVEFRGWTQDRRLRHAAFKGLREDKPAEEVELEMPREKTQKAGKAAPPGKTAPKAEAASPAVPKSGVLDFAGIRLTHPGRVLWRDQGLTKLGLAEYYAGIADRILPHIVKRPLALLRCPDGTDGPCFFQKHSFAGLTEAVEIVRVVEKDGTAETIVIHDLAGLINLVQANVLEIHPWGARIEDLDHPDTLIFDLDPGEGVEWRAVISGAQEVRQRLRDLRLESFVKTTGGKGLHVVVPIQPSVDWNTLKEFARSIAAAMEADDPSRYIATMAKKSRTGKIFVDYLRNGRGATAVAAYSARARPGAPVSTPVGWEELGPKLTAARFTVANLPRRLAALSADPWEAYFSSPQPIGEAVRLAKPGKKGPRK